MALWARGLMVRDGLDVFEGAPLEDVEVAYSLAMDHNTDKNYNLTIAGSVQRATGSVSFRPGPLPFHEVPEREHQ